MLSLDGVRRAATIERLPCCLSISDRTFIAPIVVQRQGSQRVKRLFGELIASHSTVVIATCVDKLHVMRPMQVWALLMLGQHFPYLNQLTSC